MDYLTYFENPAAVGAGVTVDTPNVAYLEDSNVLFLPRDLGDKATIEYNNENGEIFLHDYSQDYLTFEVLEAGTFKYTKSGSFTPTVEYSLDNGENWTTLPVNTETSTIAVGSKVLWRCERPNGTYSSSYNIQLGATGNFKASGNVMSMIYGDSFVNQTDLTGKTYAFYNLFKQNIKLVDASNLILPATTLADYCYQSMFNNCTSLSTAPTLPATTLANSCYDSMFRGCSNLTTAPTLPATTLAAYCYQNMFNGCTSLTTAPELPATTLASYCYYQMFRGCSSLTTAPSLPATTLADYCYTYMFNGCTSLTTAPSLPATTLADFCYNYMFSGCTSLTTAPTLPATTLTQYCYASMFSRCTSLTTAPTLPATTLASDCYRNMFYNCSKVNYIKMLATDISDSSCLSSWVYGVAATGTFVKNSAASWDVTGTNGVPSGWTVQTAAS